MKNVRIALAIIAATMAAAGCSGGGGGGGGQHGFITFGKTGGDFASFNGSAVFINQGFDLGLEEIEGLADDTCISFNNGIVLNENVVFLDAGAILTVAGPAGSIQLEPFSPDFFIYTGGSNSAGLFVRGGGYTVTVPGGDGVDAFTTNITATSDLTLNSPDPDAFDVILDKTQPLTVAWTSTGGIDPVYVTLTQDNFETDETIANVVCKFVDDGTSSIPANLLSPLQASTNPDLDTILNVAKRRFTTVDTSVGEVILAVETAWEVDLTVQ